MGPSFLISFYSSLESQIKSNQVKLGNKVLLPSSFKLNFFLSSSYTLPTWSVYLSLVIESNRSIPESPAGVDTTFVYGKGETTTSYLLPNSSIS